jgi:hypothetical protein
MVEETDLDLVVVLAEDVLLSRCFASKCLRRAFKELRRGIGIRLWSTVSLVRGRYLRTILMKTPAATFHIKTLQDLCDTVEIPFPIEISPTWLWKMNIAPRIQLSYYRSTPTGYKTSPCPYRTEPFSKSTYCLSIMTTKDQVRSWSQTVYYRVTLTSRCHTDIGYTLLYDTMPTLCNIINTIL